jgi:hypothetical protein
MSLFWGDDDDEDDDEEDVQQRQQQQHVPGAASSITVPSLFGADDDDDVKYVTHTSSSIAATQVKKEKISPAVAIVKPKVSRGLSMKRYVCNPPPPGGISLSKVSAAHKQAGEELLTGVYGKVAKGGKDATVKKLRALVTENFLVKERNFEETLLHVRNVADTIAKSNAEVSSSRSYQRLAKLIREALEVVESLKTLVDEHEEQYR